MDLCEKFFISGTVRPTAKCLTVLETRTQAGVNGMIAVKLGAGFRNCARLKIEQYRNEFQSIWKDTAYGSC